MENIITIMDDQINHCSVGSNLETIGISQYISTPYKHSWKQEKEKARALYNKVEVCYRDYSTFN